MAERRMFAKSIIDSDLFLDMPLSTQALYFHLSMRADDEGFVNNPRKIIRMIGADDDSLKLLIAKQFVIPFDSGIVVIKHWKTHNYIQKDRFKETIYTEEKSLLTTKKGEYFFNEYKKDTKCIHDVSETDTQVRLDKDRLGKVSLEEESEPADKPPSLPLAPYQKIIDMFNSVCKSFPKVKSLSKARKEAISERLKTYTINEICEAFEKAENSAFMKGRNKYYWTANFDWIMKDSNIAKIIDGNYDDENQPFSKSTTFSRSDNESGFDIDSWYEQAENYDPETILDVTKLK